MQLIPFEVVSGSHPPDLRERQRRFFQYQYVMRAIGPDLIGEDVPLPDFSIPYRIISRVPGNTTQEGRELTYRLPPQSIRIVSTVPEGTFDIRDAPDITFGRVDSLRSRAGVMDMVALVLGGLGSVMVLLAGAGVFVGRRKRVATGPRELAPHTVASDAARELSEVQEEAAAQGWDEARVGRALAAARVAAACALGRTVNQRRATDDAPAGEGRLVHRARLKGGATVISASATAEDLSEALDELPDTASPSVRMRLEALRDAIAALTAALYGRQPAYDRQALDAAVASAAAQAGSIRSERLRPAEIFRAWRSRGADADRAA
jgi:hypothetical protein